MQETIGLVAGLTGWAIFVTTLLVAERIYRALVYGVPANRFAPDGSDVTGFAQRLVRVHANNYENLALLCAAPLLALTLDRADITAPLAHWVLAARIAQGATHLISTSVPAIYVRVSFYSAQIGVTGYWLVQLAA